MSVYTAQYYEAMQVGARTSAQHVVPRIIEWIRPTSVIDVGCGTGEWLAVFHEHGVREVRGVDGHHINPFQLRIPENRFRPHDLTQPLTLDESYDLVISLEVAEHLPQRCSATFVGTLVRLAPVILFSAAMPHQGGRQHVNEQWPEYWAKHFHARQYDAIDCIRNHVWSNSQVDWWYAQNMLVFVQRGQLGNYPGLHRYQRQTDARHLSRVHPKSWLGKLQLAADELCAVVPAGTRFILVDDNKCDFSQLEPDRKAVPFLERNGEYWGTPGDSDMAIQELQRLRAQGVRFLVVAWPAFWLLDYYPQWTGYLATHCSCRLRTERLIAFDLEGVA